jgi:protein tyrosine/serine phosphatase
MVRWLTVAGGLAVAGLVVGLPSMQSVHQQRQFRNFRVVEPDKLYRSGQLPLAGLKRLIHERGIRSVVSFRYADHPDALPPDHAEELFCRAECIRYYRIKPREWSAAGDGAAPAEECVRQFLQICDDPTNYPMLVHCFAGMHRTGAYCAIYRMEYSGWSNCEAMEEMRRLGYRNLDSEEDISTFLTNYVPRPWRGVRPSDRVPRSCDEDYR